MPPHRGNALKQENYHGLLHNAVFLSPISETPDAVCDSVGRFRRNAQILKTDRNRPFTVPPRETESTNPPRLFMRHTSQSDFHGPNDVRLEDQPVCSHSTGIRRRSAPESTSCKTGNGERRFLAPFPFQKVVVVRKGRKKRQRECADTHSRLHKNISFPAFP